MCSFLSFAPRPPVAHISAGLVSPVAQAVGNTVKRVVILVATAIAFGTPMTPIGIAGALLARVHAK